MSPNNRHLTSPDDTKYFNFKRYLALLSSDKDHHRTIEY
jgi:hypothetical protein